MYFLFLVKQGKVYVWNGLVEQTCPANTASCDELGGSWKQLHIYCDLGTDISNTVCIRHSNTEMFMYYTYT